MKRRRLSEKWGQKNFRFLYYCLHISDCGCLFYDYEITAHLSPDETKKKSHPCGWLIDENQTAIIRLLFAAQAHQEC
jgi:hypothetical protein